MFGPDDVDVVDGGDDDDCDCGTMTKKIKI